MRKLRASKVLIAAAALLTTAAVFLLTRQLLTKSNSPTQKPDQSGCPAKVLSPTYQDDSQRRSVGSRDKKTGECIDFYKRTNGELSLYGLPDYIKTNDLAVSTLKKDCQMVYQTGHFDVTGDGKKDILMITEAIDCVTCRATSLIIISDSKVILDRQVSNAMIRQVKDIPNAFELKEPIYLHGEGLCCPTKGTVSVYEYREGSTEGFVLTDQYIEKYSTSDFPTFNERQNIE